MKSRTKVILIIIAAWILLISLILLVSESIFIKGFAKLEGDLAADNANRVAHVSLSTLNYIYLQNLDNAYWDKTYDYMKKRNHDFIKDNFLTDFFIDNKINYVMIFDNNQNLIWSRGYDLTKEKNIAVEPKVIQFFQNHGLAMLENKKAYYSSPYREYGDSGFLQLADDIGYFSINFIKDSNDRKSPLGYMVFGRILSSDFFKNLSSDLGYPIYLISLSDIQKNPNDQLILKKLSEQDTVYTEPLNDDVYLSYLLVKDFAKHPIGILKIEQPRKIYNESKRSALDSQLILLGLALLGMFAMSALVYLFFRKQDLITRSFERFVPHQLIELLEKKDILEIGLGNNAKKCISVLFMDIRNFTPISESLSPQENFDFINILLKEIAPVISNNNGFIDKYIGDAVMALFPGESNADDAVKAARMILEELTKLNQEGILKIKEPVKIGIGINSGDVMLGIIGAEGRLEGTVISDMVNTASRIQTLTKTYGHEILISEQCYKSMKYPELYPIEHVDEALLKGKMVKITIYSVT